MFKVTCLFLAFLFSFTVSHGKADADLSKVNVITSFYEPYSYLSEGSPQGIAVNQARKIFAELNFFPAIKIYPWARAYTHALNEPNTVLFSIARTPEREEKFHWIGEIVGFDVYLFREKSRDDIQINTLSDATNYKVGALIKDVKGQYLEKNHVTVTEINNEETGIKMILNKRLELLPVDLVSLQHRLKKLGFDQDQLVPAFHLKEISRPLYIVLSRNSDPEVVAAFKAAYKRAFP
ncbi:MAG: transporter substrate-binding domain-containing protein [Methylocystaceae bacterium]|nr:transporter substrate-binding domain-containing protein [Methylocystaceae bacterium]